MTGLFRFCMRYGAAILFLVAFAQLLVGLIPVVYGLIGETGQMAADYNYTPDGRGLAVAFHLQSLMVSVSSAAFPFFGALVIDRLDRWLAVKGRGPDE